MGTGEVNKMGGGDIIKLIHLFYQYSYLFLTNMGGWS
jgi:hypothetical protein